jgi:cobalt-zinc-cadmium efflux system outer membrane protein
MTQARSLAALLSVALLALAGCADSPRGAPPEPRPLGAGLPAFQAPNDPAARVPEEALPREPEGTLTLREALALALMRNPELAAFSWETRAAEARALQAGLPPNPELGIDLEDFAGTGTQAGFKGAQLALQLSQVVELGGKRLKRARAAQCERDLAAWDYEAKRLDVYTQTAQAYVELLAAQERQALAQDTLRLAERAFAVVAERVRAGKVSPVEESKARVAQTTARVAAQRAESDARTARRALAATWGAATPSFTRVEGDLTPARPTPSFEDLARLLAQNPDLARWTAEMALRRAVIDLEQAKAWPDVALGGGVKNSWDIDERTGILGLSIPLPLFDRNQGGILEARYRLAKSEEERRAIEVRVMTELYRTHQALAQAHSEAAALQSEAMPAAQSAFDGAQEGYQRGKWGYLEVLDAQRTLFDVRAQWIDALARYHKALADTERLIGQGLDSVAASPVARN